MLNPIASEAMYSATYVDNYLDSVENLPDDVQRHLSRIRDIDVQYRSHLRDVDHYYDVWKSMNSHSEHAAVRSTRAVNRMQQSLLSAQELGDEKMHIVNQLQELIDAKTRQLDVDQQNLDIKEDLQQQQMQRAEELLQAACEAPSQPKYSRLQSPLRGNVESTLSHTIGTNGSASFTSEQRHSLNGSIGGNDTKDYRSNSITDFTGMRAYGSGGGGSTPNSERSANGGGSTGAANSANSLNGNMVGETQRSGSKRSRRRTDTVASGTVDLVGNESNSNEAASSGGGNERTNTQRSSNASGSTTQKKNVGGQNVSGSGNAAGASGSGAAAAGGGNNSGKKKKRKARGAHTSAAQANAREETPPPEAIDPDEPTYCVCNQISFGEMILCDNDLCPIEWFHFSCVALVFKPKGKWFCPNCRGDRPNIMKPKAQFLKELERYNKEKEEKT